MWQSEVEKPIGNKGQNLPRWADSDRPAGAEYDKEGVAGGPDEVVVMRCGK